MGYLRRVREAHEQVRAAEEAWRANDRAEQAAGLPSHETAQSQALDAAGWAAVWHRRDVILGRDAQ